MLDSRLFGHVRILKRNLRNLRITIRLPRVPRSERYFCPYLIRVNSCPFAVQFGFLKGAKGDLPGALADYDTAVKLDGLDALGYHGRAVSKLASADLDGALTDLQTSIERSQTDRQRFYDQIHLWIVLADLKRAAEANQGLTDYLQNRNLANAEPWMTAIAEFLLDKSDEAALLAAAKRGYNEVAIRGQTAEAFFFAGLKGRLAGDGQKAADYFSQCVAAHQTAYYEYVLANAELKKR
jgi:lipoprotein NlpI